MLVSTIIFLLSAIVCAAATQPERLSIQGRKSEAIIRQTLLERTPIGSKAIDVAWFVNQRLIHDGGDVPSFGNGSAWHLVATGKKKEGNFEFDSVPDLTPRFSEKWIGSDFNMRIIVAIYQGFPFKVWVTATWGFDRDGRLRTIIVEKQADAL